MPSPYRMRRPTARVPTCRIVVPVSPETDAALQARRHEMSLRDQVLAALGVYGIDVPSPRRSCATDGSPGRQRTRTSGYSLSVILPRRVFEALQQIARTRRETIVYLVRVALAAAGYPIAASDEIVDRRRAPVRRPRSHYAMAKDKVD